MIFISASKPCLVTYMVNLSFSCNNQQYLRNHSFWDMAQCCSVSNAKQFKGMYCLHL